MRWMFLLLLVLNVFYYVWHQQEAPLRAKDVTPLSLYKGSQQDIRLLSEGGRASKEKSGPQRTESQCLYLGGFARQEMVAVLGERLAQMDIKAQPSLEGSSAAGFWIRIAPESRRLADDLPFESLANEFNELKHKIMPCEGIATVE